MGVAAQDDETVEISSEGRGGVLMVPCISRIARPEGVWRRLGSELGCREGDVGRMCSGIDGMMIMAMGLDR